MNLGDIRRENATSSPDAWQELRDLTPARIALGRAGSALPTQKMLEFGLAHARARDAVHHAFDAAGLALEIEKLGFTTLRLDSAATSRELYLRRPDLGRRLGEESREKLIARPQKPCDLSIIVADGLSALAVHSNVAALLAEMAIFTTSSGYSLAPVSIVSHGRVAIGDEIGALLQARAALVLLGERPGLSSPDSLGAYLTLGPKPGRLDAERNCISNIRREGLSPGEAAYKIIWHLARAFELGLTGIGLRDESDSMPLKLSMDGDGKR